MKFAVLLAITQLLLAQLENTGKPIRVKTACTREIVHDLGLDCTSEHPCPLYLELADVELVGNRILVSGNLHTDSVTVESVLLGSEDFGKTWNEIHSRLPLTALESIQFFDFEIGWISGQILHPRPHDAFFLISSDGGKTWRKRPVFGETRTGSVEQFWFDSRTHGLLVMDRLSAAEDGMRHELWESMTGGESWSIRQVDSKPLPFSRPRTLAEDWRIRADAPSKSHKIERRVEGKWQAIASFAVRVGECKPPEPEPRPDVPPSEEPVAEEPAVPEKPTPPPKPKGTKRQPSLKR